MNDVSVFVFANCKGSKIGQWEGLGTRLAVLNSLVMLVVLHAIKETILGIAE